MGSTQFDIRNASKEKVTLAILTKLTIWYMYKASGKSVSERGVCMYVVVNPLNIL